MYAIECVEIFVACKAKDLTFISVTKVGLCSFWFIEFGPPMFYSRPEETYCKLLVSRLGALLPSSRDRRNPNTRPGTL